jgi:predicted Ser/Thr protein kinase
MWEISPDELKFVEKIGVGQSAKVYKGFYRGQSVAVKVLKGDLKDREFDSIMTELDIFR